jgi:Ca2+-binding RTX toxin-like protein
MFDDVLKGLDGDDWLNGSYGNDVLVGGKGSDVLFCCEGADIFRLEKVTDSLIGAEDEVVDFTAGVDKIDLTQLDANVKLKGVQAFTLSEAGPASNAVWFVPDAEGIGYALCGDVNGDATADFSIIIGAISAPLASDDILGLA